MFSEASGNKCRKAPPINTPADKETKNIFSLDNVSFLKNKKITATQTHKVIKKVANKIWKKIIISDFYFIDSK